MFLICTFFLFISLVVCKVPTEKQIRSMFAQKFGEVPWKQLESWTSNDFEMFVSGVPMGKGKPLIEKILAMPIANQLTTIDSVIVSGQVATVHRHTQITGKAGCTALISAVDIVTFDNSGKISKMEWYPNKELETIIAEANCKRVFPSETLKYIIKKNNFADTSFEWNTDVFGGNFDDKVVVKLLGIPPINGKKEFLELCKTLDYKSFVISFDDIVTAGNTAISVRSVWGTTKSGCTFFTRDVVKTTHSYPDGKIIEWEALAEVSDEIERCGSHFKKPEL